MELTQSGLTAADDSRVLIYDPNMFIIHSNDYKKQTFLDNSHRNLKSYWSMMETSTLSFSGAIYQIS